MTPAQFKALPIGATVTDGGSGQGTVFEKKLEWCTILWSAPPSRVSGVSAVDYDDPQIRRWTGSGGGGPSTINVYGSTMTWQIMPDGHVHMTAVNDTASTGMLYGTSSVDGVAQATATVSIDAGLTADGLLSTYIYGLYGFPPWNYVFTFGTGTADVWPEATHTKKFTAFGFALGTVSDGAMYGTVAEFSGAVQPTSLTGPTTIVASTVDPWGNTWSNVNWSKLQVGDHIRLTSSDRVTVIQTWTVAGLAVLTDRWTVSVTGTATQAPAHGDLITMLFDYQHA